MSDLNTQLRIEEEMSGHGVERYWKQQDYKDNTSHLKTGNKTLIGLAVDPLSQAISEWVDQAMTGVGRKHSAAAPLSKLDPEVLAFITLRGMFDMVLMDWTVQHVAIKLGGVVETESRMMWFAEQNPEYFEAVLNNNLELGNSPARTAVTLQLNFHKKGYKQYEQWTKTVQLNVGMILMELAINHTGYFERITDAYANDTTYRLGLTKRTEEWIGKQVEKHSVLCPVYLPTVIKPKPWTGATGGGYYHEILPKLKLVKTRHKQYLEELEVHSMPKVYRAVNAIQETPWAINKDVLAVLKDVWEMGGGVGSLPTTYDKEKPPLPDLDFETRDVWSDQEKQTWKEWKWAAKRVHRYNVGLRSKRLGLLKALWVADKFKDFDNIYFPHQLDFRGRLYAIPNYINPQGDDISRGLLKFAEGKPINNAEQMKWLAVHGANLWGEDKCSLDQRVHWVRDNNDSIVACAADPIENMWWTEADKPWQFLAWCLEWAGFMGQGYGFMSHLPVAMDGSCNGLQIFSLILKDPVGGYATNLMPAEKPQDIYQIVADKVIVNLKETVKTSDDPAELEMAMQLLEFGISRKTTKRQVMVLPYGGTFRSCMEYTREHLEERVSEGAVSPWGEDLYPASAFLAKRIWDAIHQTVLSARMCMQWLQDVAKACSKQEIPVNWTTPVGFPVMQAYPELKAKRVSTRLGDTMVKLTLSEPTNKLDRRRQANGISPNFVHSLDAAALILSVCKTLDKGVTNFAMIHDSYATHAADSPTLARCLREAFVELFSGHAVLENFLVEVAPVLGDSVKKITSLPATGDLDVNKVLESEYFFA